ncbi:MAG: response regulator [Bacteroidales bacterium]|nr:response regulator [Bacteroidales bacterium]MCF8388188.1 response regulator [Bacteroidales bacterium]
MEEKTIKLLMLEDNPSDAELIVRELEKSGYQIDYKRVDKRENFIEDIIRFKPHVIISDYSLPQYNGIDAILDAQKVNPNIPLIVVTGSLDEETAAETIKKGAWDYVVKERLFRLPSSLEATLKLKKEQDKKAEIEASLNQTRTEFESLRNNVPLALYRSAPDGKLLYVNKAFVEMFRYESTDQAINDNAKNHYVDFHDRDQLLKVLMKKGEVQHYEIKLKRKDGSTFWGSFNIRAIFDNNGEHIHQDGIIADITEIKNAREEVVRAKEKAEESDRLKTAFLANMSHEIRTPMNAIIGFTDLIASGELEEEEVMEFISHIQKNGETLLQIIGDIIDVAKIESGSIRVNMKTEDVNKFIRQVYEELEEKKAEEGKEGIDLILVNKHESDEVKTKSDFIRLKQIMDNLTNNALKFTEEGKVKLGYDIVNGEIRFFVSDTGIGIPPEMKDVIFERFRQVDDSHTREFGGTGLGLTIAKSFVEELGGRMWVESEVYKGSTFYFTIPLVEEMTEPKPFREDVDDYKFKWKGRKVLVAEDVESNYHYLEVILKAHNIEPLRAANGVEAVALCKTDKDIDLVLMDIQMPEMNGYEATRKIKQFRKDLPVIGQTAFALSTDRSKVMDAGCSDYLVKPILKSSLLEVLDKYL